MLCRRAVVFYLYGCFQLRQRGGSVKVTSFCGKNANTPVSVKNCYEPQKSKTSGAHKLIIIDYLGKTGSLSRKMMSFLSAASPSARTAALPTVLPPALLTSASSALSDSPVLITSSMMRTLFPLIFSASSAPR